MGAIAAVVSKKGEDVIPKVIVALRELKHRGADASGVATPTSVTAAKFINKINIGNMCCSVAVGHNLWRVNLKDFPQPVLCDGYALAFEGRLFPAPKVSDVEEVRRRLGFNVQRNAKRILEQFDGSYTFAIAQPNKIVAGRDTLGTNPLYYGENETFCAVASERKALWTIGIKETESFPPGNLAVINSQGFAFQPVTTVAPLAEKMLGIEEAATRLQNLLLESIQERVADVQRVAVAFSGGLDSSVVSLLTKECGVVLHLISVGLEGQQELENAEVAAEALDMPLNLQTYTMKDVEGVLAKVLWLIEEPNLMKVGVAIPFFWSAEVASRLECNVLLAGQGADELFGGYRKYLTIYAKKGVVAVQNAMQHDVTSSYETNFQRDNAVCAFHKVELRLPFADREVVRFALSLPVELKIESAADSLRKRVLRRVARNIGIPPFIVNRTKKAVQFATGVDKALRTLARKEGLTSTEYVKRVFRRVYPNAGV